MNSIIEHQLDTFDPEGHPELKAAYDECISEHEKTIDALKALDLQPWQQGIAEGLSGPKPFKVPSGRGMGRIRARALDAEGQRFLAQMDNLHESVTSRLARMYHTKNEALMEEIFDLAKEFTGNPDLQPEDVVNKLVLVKQQNHDAPCGFDGRVFYEKTLLATFGGPTIQGVCEVYDGTLHRVWYPEGKKGRIARIFDLIKNGKVSFRHD